MKKQTDDDRSHHLSPARSGEARADAFGDYGDHAQTFGRKRE